MAWQPLRSKLEIPFSRTKLVTRPRLIERLNAGMAHRLVLVSAPAGYGKTTLLGEWAKRSKKQVAWISLDQGDNDPTRFWAYFVTAVQSLRPNVGSTSLKMLSATAQPPMNAILISLLNELSEDTQPLIIVVDDYHLIQEESIHDAVAFLIDNIPRRTHLVLAARSDPPLPINRLRVRNQLAELRAEDLRFPAGEADAFLKDVMGLDVSVEQVATLEERTEGWIAGLQMAALAIRKVEDVGAFLSSFAGSHKYVEGYLAAEVLRHQSEEVQRFLLPTSILNHLCAPLCRALTGREDSQALLEKIEAANLFVVPLDDERRWYRYHHLFGESLQNHLRRLHPERVEDLHLRASTWYDSNGHANDAIHHALEGGHEERAADLLEKNALGIFYSSERVTLRNWMSRLSEEIFHSRPMLCVADAWSLMADRTASSYDRIESRLRDAETALARHRPPSRTPEVPEWITLRRVEGFVVTIRAHVARERGESPHRVIDYSHKALERLSEEDLDLRSTVLVNLGLAYLQAGDLDSATRSSDEAKAVGDRCGNLYMADFAAYILARISIYRGRLQQAERICREAVESSRLPSGRGMRPLPSAGGLRLCLGAVQLEQNRLEEARGSLEEGLELLELTAEPGVMIHGYASLLRLKLAQGEDASVASALADRIEPLERFRAGAASFAAALRIKTMLARGQDQPASLEEAVSCTRTHVFDLDDFEKVPRHFQEGLWHLAGQLAGARLRIVRARHEGLPRGRDDLLPVQGFLDRQLAAAKERGMLGTAVEILILKAMAYQAHDLTEEALASLERALELGESEGYVRLFLDEGAPMGDLLDAAVSRGIHERYATELGVLLRRERDQNLRKTGDSSSAHGLIESLSKRELDVLRLIASGSSNQQIADELFLAMGTVKKHNNNIFAKLDVNSRTQAIARAKQLGIL